MKRLLLLLFFPLMAFGQAVTVTWTNTHQTMDGFGGEDWQCCETLTQAQANTFFSTASGIGLSIIRTGNYGCPSTGACPVTTGNVPDLGTLQKAVALGAVVDMNIASPPASLKYSGTFGSGTPGASGSCLATTNYTAFATYTVQWIQMMNANSVPITILDVANEPDSPSPTSNSLGACFWNAAQLDLYIGTYLGPALTSAGLTTVKVMMPNTGYWFGGASGDLYSTCLADSACNKYIGIVATQGYGNSGAPDGFSPQSGYCCSTYTTPPSNTNTYHIWQSEINGGLTYNSTAGLWNWDASMSPDALVWARNIHDAIITGNVSGYEYWELADCCPSESGAPFNDGLMQANLSTTSKRMYVVGNWSEFVRPGMVRIDTGSGNPQAGIYVTAFKNASTGAFAIVVLNSNSGGIPQTFDLTSFPTLSGGSVTPYATSSTQNLAQLAPVTVSGSSFSYTVPGESVLTFVGTANGTGGTVTYVSQSGGSFSGGSACNGKATVSIATSNGTSYTAGTTVYLCGVITSAVNFADGAGGVSGNPITVLFDTGARVSLPFCDNICFDISIPYVTVNGQVACHSGTTCSTNEFNNQTGYPTGIGGVIEATQEGTPNGGGCGGSCANAGSAADTAYTQSGTTITVTSSLNPGVGNYVWISGATPTGYNGYWKVLTSATGSFTGGPPPGVTAPSGLGAGTGGSAMTIISTGQLIATSSNNTVIENLIIRNLYQHPATSNGYADPIGGGGSFVAIDGYSATNLTVANNQIHDADTIVNNASGPGCSGYFIYNNYWFHHGWGFHGGTNGSGACSDWEVHDNRVGDSINWDQLANNAHHNPLGFLSRGGEPQGAGSFNGVYIYNNLVDGLITQTANGVCSPGDAGNHITSVMYFSGGPIVDAYIYNNVINLANSPCGTDDAIWTLNGETGSSTWQANNTIIDSPGFSGEGCDSNGAGTYVQIGNVEKDCNNFQFFQGAITFPGLDDYNIYGEQGTGGAGLWQSSVFGNTSTFATWLTNLTANACSVPTSGCETHSAYYPGSGSLLLGAEGVPETGSPVINSEINICVSATSSFTCVAQLAALAYDTSAGSTRVPVLRPTGGTLWSAGAYATSGVTPPPTANPICSPPGGTFSVSQSVTCTDATAGATMCYTINGSTPVPNGSGGCTTGNLYTSPGFGVLTFGVTLDIVQIVAGGSGIPNSSVVIYTYQLSQASQPAQIPWMFARVN